MSKLELILKKLACSQISVAHTVTQLRGLQDNQATIIEECIKHILKQIDLNFDPREVPELNSTPPEATGLRSGISPNAITDPKLRAEHQEALKKNTKASDYYRKQTLFRALLNELTKL